MAFVKRTLARFRKLQETGISCFDQPIFRDIFSAASSSSNSQTIDVPANGEPANQFVSAQHLAVFHNIFYLEHLHT